MTPRCTNTDCLKETTELVPYPVYAGASVCVKLCRPCAKERRAKWLQENRPTFAVVK